CGDGDMMEGISHEAASIAGHLQLSNLIWIYDSNRVTIEGHTDLAYSDDVETRFKGYHWNTLRVDDANDAGALEAALNQAKANTDKPTLIVVKSIIGWGAPHKQDSSAAHGEPLGVEEIKLAKKFYGWPEDSSFLVPDGVYEHFNEGIGARGHAAREQWLKDLKDYASKYPDLAKEFERIEAHELPEGWDSDIPTFDPDAKGMASRESSGKVLNAIAKNFPWMIGGSADLSPSTKTDMKFEGAGSFEHDSYGGRNLHFGIREHVMGAICNGLALSNLRPYGSTFLIFSDYMKPPIRLSSIMEVPVIYVFTHDSIGVGEDGPTHQPIEQMASLRGVPGLSTFRPGDANEVAECWREALSHPQTPACIVVSRQAMPTFDRTKYASAKGVHKGAYVLADAEGGKKPAVILMGTGTEVGVCVEVYEKLKSEGIAARVVSMPSWDLFEKQDESYKESVLPTDVHARVCVEQAASLGWDRYVGRLGSQIVMRTFGASAPFADLKKKFGFTSEHVYDEAKKQLARVKSSQ
ncbi:MAG TPA: transketolase, partial [Paraburkholderia sp.]